MANDNAQNLAQYKNLEAEKAALGLPQFESESSVFHEEKDVLVQFRANLQQLEDLTGRLHFVMGEVGEALKKRR